MIVINGFLQPFEKTSGSNGKIGVSMDSYKTSKKVFPPDPDNSNKSQPILKNFFSRKMHFFRVESVQIAHQDVKWRQRSKEI